MLPRRIAQRALCLTYSLPLSFFGSNVLENVQLLHPYYRSLDQRSYTNGDRIALWASPCPLVAKSDESRPAECLHSIPRLSAAFQCTGVDR
jgi:hypothetical protein